MKCQILMIALVALAITAPTAFAEGPAGLEQTAIQASPATADSTTFTEAEMAAADRLQAAYPGVAFYRYGTTLSRVYGRAFGIGDSVEQTAARFVAENADMFGAVPSDLLPTTTLLQQGNQLPLLYDRETGTYKLTLVYYSQYRDGVPVFRAGLRLLVSNEPGNALVWAGSNLKRLGEFHPDPNLASSVNPAQIAAGFQNISTPEPVIWAGINEDTLLPRQALSFEASDDTGLKHWLYVVDAATGEVLYRENLILFTDVTGSVQGKATTIPKSDTCNPEVDSPMKYAKVTIGSTTAYADANGNFTIPNGGTSAVTVTSAVAGQYFTVDNYAGSEDTLTANVTPPGPINFLHNGANTSEPVRAQTNAYVQANVVRDWVLTYHPSFPTVYTQTNFPLYVNRTDGYCPANAWYSSSGGGSMHFCSSSGSYPNTAYSSVVHHEYGHHLCQVAGTGQDQYGEGVGDSVAVCIADDPILGYGFTGNCDAGIRTADNTMQYPCSSEIHTCAQLLSGCVWDTREALHTAFPTTYLAVLSTLMVNSIPMHAGSGTINTAIFTDWITLDGAMGGLHYAQIYAGFQAHNMAPLDVIAPTPNPMTFASTPSPVVGSTTSMTMTATTGYDLASPPVRYYFDFVSGGPGGGNSSWQVSPTYVDTGLLPNTLYTYRVQARDSASPTPNVTGVSSNATGVTNIQTPTGLTFGTTTANSIVLMASGTLSNLMAGSSGVYFDCTTPGGNGGIGEWLKVTTDTATGLAPNTGYTFQAKARNMYAVESPYCPTASKVTLANAPTAPTLSGATTTTLNLDVNANGNPAATEFAVRCTAAAPADSTWVGKYVDAFGAPSASAVWQTDAQWATTSVTGLERCNSYTFAVKARNSESVETAFGAGATLSTTGRQGDMNGDDEVDGDDIQAYVQCAIAGGGEQCGCIGGVSVATFVNCLLDAGSCP
jgi:hypothetical protein